MTSERYKFDPDLSRAATLPSSWYLDPEIGLRSRTYQSGRYSVQRENGLHHFHGLLSRFLPQGFSRNQTS